MGEIMNEEDYLENASIFAAHIVVALDCLEEARAMNRIFSQEKYQSHLKTAPNFFKTAYHAMLYRFQMEVALLFEENSNVISFLQFKNQLAQDHIIGKEQIEKFKSAYKDSKAVLGDISKKRNKYLAHLDKQYFNAPGPFIYYDMVDFDKLESLLRCMLYICNYVIMMSTKKGIARIQTTRNGDDFVKLFGYLTKDEEKEDRL